jgi:outer membrane protein OmpA-like peptidoglycan-associated protein
MHIRHIFSAIAALCLATSAAAQPAGTWELGAFGRYTDFADVLLMRHEYGGGGSIGFFPLSRLELEAATSLTSTVRPAPFGDVTYVPIQARLVYNQPILAFLDVMVGAGYILSTYKIDREWYGDSGVTGLLGARLNLSRRFALRLSGTADYLPAYSEEGVKFEEQVNLSLEAGISVLLGGRPRGGGEPVVVASEAAEVQEARAPTDADGDGVLDDVDRCPNTPPGIVVAADGCPPPVVEEPPAEEVMPPPVPDSDGDGVSDGHDRCPDTAVGVEVDSLGCPLTRDSDGDGVIDADDRCADTPPGTDVDSAGCPVLIDVDAIEITLEGAFRSGTWELTPAAREVLDGVAQTLLAYPSLRVQIAGYTDNVGEERRNVWLSQTRADAVKLYLSRQGVPRDRMVTRGYGPADPVASNETAEGRARNRRVELRRLR